MAGDSFSLKVKRIFGRSAPKTTVPPSPTPAPALLRIVRTATLVEKLRQMRIEKAANKSCLFETLPEHVHRRILSYVPMDSLFNVVLSSSLFYDHFASDTLNVMADSLQNMLRCSSLDAFTSYKCGFESFRDAREQYCVKMFLKIYRNRQGVETFALRDRKITEKDLIEMYKFHVKVIEPLVDQYAAWALRHLEYEADSTDVGGAISDTERVRIIRALYRFEIGCNVCADTSGYWVSPPLTPDEFTVQFFFNYEAWEVEEMLCVADFVFDKMNKVFDEVENDLAPGCERIAGSDGSETPVEAFDLHNDRLFLLPGTISRGLAFVKSTDNKKHNDLVRLMQAKLVSGENFFFAEGGVYHERMFQTVREITGDLGRYSKQQDREALPFKGDHDVFTTGPGVPYAWTSIWKETYSSVFGCKIPGGLRPWGYVMWDAERIKRSRVKDLLEKQWELVYWSHDPRDLFC